MVHIDSPSWSQCASADAARSVSPRPSARDERRAAFDVEWLLAPLSPAQWLAEFHERQPMVVERDDRNYFARFFSIDDFDRLLSCGEWTWPRLRLLTEGEPVPTATYVEPAAGTYASSRIQLDKLLAGYRSGASILMDAERFCDPVAKLVRSLEALLSYRVGSGIWLAPAGAAATPFHSDVTNALIVQISGSEHWRIFEPPVANPIIEMDAELSGNHLVPGKLVCDVTLRSGDVLYVPRGFGHEVTPSSDEPSLHIGLAWQVPTVYQVVRDTLVELMCRAPRLRESLPPGFANAEGEQRATELVESVVGTFLPDLDFRSAVSQLSRKFLQDSPRMLRGAFAQSCRRSAVTLETSGRRRPHVLSHLERRGELLCLSFHGKTLRMPPCAEAALRFILQSDDFIASLLPGDLEGDEKLELVETLLNEGFLMLPVEPAVPQSAN